MDDIERLELAPAAEWPEPLDRKTNVYLLKGQTPALIGAGHVAQRQGLVDALAAHDLSPDDIERVIHTSWDVTTLSGAQNLPRADHFVWSPDMVQPANFERVVEKERARIRSLAERVVEIDPDWDRADVEQFVERFYPRVSTELKVVPVRSGHIIRAGELKLEVVAAGGPSPGHALLHDSSRDYLFTGDLSLMGLPAFVAEVQPMLVAYEKAIALEPNWIFPSSGTPRKRGAWSLRQAFRFINSFLENAPLALGTSPTLLEFVERDLGYRPESFVTYLFSLLRYQPLLDELVRAHSIEVEGEGLDGKHYGIDIDDTRDTRLRQL